MNPQIQPMAWQMNPGYYDFSLTGLDSSLKRLLSSPDAIMFQTGGTDAFLPTLRSKPTEAPQYHLANVLAGRRYEGTAAVSSDGSIESNEKPIRLQGMKCAENDTNEPLLSAEDAEQLRKMGIDPNHVESLLPHVLAEDNNATERQLGEGQTSGSVDPNRKAQIKSQVSGLKFQVNQMLDAVRSVAFQLNLEVEISELASGWFQKTCGFVVKGRYEDVRKFQIWYERMKEANS